MTKFDWMANESAPDDVVMQVIRGDFRYSEGGGLYIPNLVILHNGWGKGRSNHVVGSDLKPIPNRLDITFFSYLENHFYKGTFELPYERIVKMFNEGYYSPSEKEKITYHRITAGIAPGGVVSVWVGGIDRITEVFQGKAEKSEEDFKVIIDNPKYTRESYVQVTLDRTLTPEQLAKITKNGIPLTRWKDYHKKRYHWQPVLNGFEIADGLISQINYLNGEQDYLYLPMDEKLAKETRAIPKEIHFRWIQGDRKKPFRLHFDPQEIFEVFDRLGKGGKPLVLEMRSEKAEKGYRFSVWVKNGSEDVYLAKYRIEK